ncbi:unnamed protein product [Cladocopium goreaui]|uniref:C2H2-type domain-containing protein n=1 Tax=Cladocopium goreaui TaxID=2562237 RepID=A0A9P1D5D7_9DINO|nr:unnamed protein product [Cladocopium goreaui]
MGVDFAHQFLQAHRHWTQVRRLPSAYLFFDIKSAFYSVLRQALFPCEERPLSLIAALRRFRIGIEDIDSMLTAVQSDDATAGVSDHFRLLLKDALTNTHFFIQGLDTPCQTHRGTRPGDPLGDLLYNMVMALVMKDARDVTAGRTGAAWIGAPASCADFTQEIVLPVPAFLDLAFVDDCAVAIHAGEYAQVVHIVQSAVGPGAMDQAAKQRGLLLNYAPGKTEVILNVRVAGSTAAKVDLHAAGSRLHWEMDETLYTPCELSPATNGSVPDPDDDTALVQRLHLVPMPSGHLEVLAECHQKAFRQFYSDHFAAPDSDDLRDWLPLIRLDPSWHGRVRAAGKACRWYRQACAESTTWNKQFDESFVNQGGVLPSRQTIAQERWACDQCEKWCLSKRALASHSARVHGYRHLVLFYATGEVCHSCCRWYHNRSRLVEHLRDATRCMETLQACFPPISEEQLAAYDMEEHEATALLKRDGWGATKALCPMRRVHGPSLPPPASEEAKIMHDKYAERLASPGHGFARLQGRREAPAQQESRVHLFAEDFPAFVFNTPEGFQLGNGRYDQAGLAREYAMLHVRSLVFVHFFSGYRREQDLHQQLEHRSIDNGPRALRSEAFPWGLPSLKPREWKQVLVGTRLLHFLLSVILLLAQVGGCGFCELGCWKGGQRAFGSTPPSERFGSYGASGSRPSINVLLGRMRPSRRQCLRLLGFRKRVMATGNCGRFTRLRSIELLQMQFSSSPSTFAGCTVDPEIASELLAFNHSDFVAHDQAWLNVKNKFTFEEACAFFSVLAPTRSAGGECMR